MAKFQFSSSGISTASRKVMIGNYVCTEGYMASLCSYPPLLAGDIPGDYRRENRREVLLRQNHQ